jgi:hypothetical protein
VYSFKPGTDASWQTASSLPAGVIDLAATTGADGTIYAIGGSGSNTVYSLQPDSTAPTTTISLNPAQPSGQNNWYSGPVTVSVRATDPDDAASTLTTRCVLDPAPPPASFTDLPSGPCPYAASGGAAVSTDGTHTLYAASEDPYNQVEAPAISSGPFPIDATPPTVSCQSPAPSFAVGQAGATVSATVSDATSGPAQTTITAPAPTTSAGSFSVSLTGYDTAG